LEHFPAKEHIHTGKGFWHLRFHPQYKLSKFIMAIKCHHVLMSEGADKSTTPLFSILNEELMQEFNISIYGALL
jgi:hypothetical protein